MTSALPSPVEWAGMLAWVAERYGALPHHRVRVALREQRAWVDVTLLAYPLGGTGARGYWVDVGSVPRRECGAYTLADWQERVLTPAYLHLQQVLAAADGAPEAVKDA